MARTNRIRREGDAHYHVMSRTNDRRFLFERGQVKRRMVDILRRSAEFSGVRLEAFCMMDDHFHIVCKVLKPDAPIPEDEVIRRIGVLKGGAFAAETAARWTDLRKSGLQDLANASLASWRARMNDVSQFAKTFKELVGIAYKAACRERGKDYCGSIWSGRFKSTLIEGGRYLAACVRDVELNPVRAGMVNQAREYAYSSANEPKANEINGFAGTVPAEWGTSRVAQIGEGLAFGCRAFVMGVVVDFGRCFAGSPAPKRVMTGVARGLSPSEAWAVRGWKLAENREIAG